MTPMERVAAYIQAWNDHDADAVLATLGPSGTYEDPTTGGPVNGEAFRANATGLWTAFPDLSFETVSEAPTGPDTAAAQWIMRGTNTGSMRGMPPTGKAVTLKGADFFTFADDHIATVTGYFDGGAVPRQLGLNIIVQPFQAGPFRFGDSVCVSSGKRQEPGAFSITYLEALDGPAGDRVRGGSRDSLIDMLHLDGFIGATTSRIGNRMVTVSAWTDAQASRQVMKTGAHAEAMKWFTAGEVASAGYTSVWSLERNNGFWVRCDACGRMSRNSHDGDACACGAALPDHPPYW
ncbi:MAG: ester cyclase [Rhodobacterales bacterium]|nr:ester cyclase [Rhodobacterales bacterium]